MNAFTCLCRDTPRRFVAAQVNDAAPSRRDPTGTADIRARFRGDLDKRWAKLRALTLEAFATGIVGPATAASIHSSMQMARHYGSGGDPVRDFQAWFDEALRQVVVGDGAWLRRYVEDAIGRARVRAGKLVTRDGLHIIDALPTDRTQALTSLAMAELQGVCEAVSQQAVRCVAHMLLAHQGAPKVARGVSDVISAVGKVRSRQMADYMVVKAFNGATLDAYRAAGIGKVGVVPERLRIKKGAHGKTLARDEFNPDEPRDPAGKWTSGDRNAPQALSREEAKAAYENNEVPEGWYVHGRSDQGAGKEDPLATGNVIQMTKDVSTGDDYAGQKGSVYFLAPGKDTDVIDVSKEEGLNRIKEQFSKDFDRGTLPSRLDDALHGIDDVDEAWDTVKEGFDPKDIVSSAEWYDTDVVNWLGDNFPGAFFKLTEGAVSLDPSGLQRHLVRGKIGARDDFNPDEPRDPAGKWTSGAGGAIRDRVGAFVSGPGKQAINLAARKLSENKREILASAVSASLSLLGADYPADVDEQVRHQVMFFAENAQVSIAIARGYMRLTVDGMIALRQRFSRDAMDAKDDVLEALLRLKAVLAKDDLFKDAFNPDQPRDDHGRWTGGLSVSDDGVMIHIEPEGMRLPEWGRNLRWGLTAYRSEIRGEKAIRIRDVRVPEEMQGHGIGMALYVRAAQMAAKEGLPLQSDSTVTQAAANAWMSLNRRGYNVKMAPDKVFRPGPPEAPHLSRFETPDGTPVFQIKDGLDLADKVFGWSPTASPKASNIFERPSRAAPTPEEQEAIEEGEAKLQALEVVEVLNAEDPCPICEEISADGPYDIDEAEGLIPAHPNAVLEGSTIASYGPMHEMVRARFSGPAICFRTRSKVTTIGPNHPMLTRRGFIKACDLRKGDELLYDARTDGAFSSRRGTFDFKQMPFVEDVFEALLLVCGGRTFASSAHHNLHGDAVFCQGKIEVVHPTRDLLPIIDPCGIEQFSERTLPLSNADLKLISSLRSSQAGIKTFNLPSTECMSSRYLEIAFGLGHPVPFDSLLLGSRSEMDLLFAQDGHDYLSTCLIMSSECEDPISGSIASGNRWPEMFIWDAVLDIHEVQFSGWAFDATTETALYSSDGFVVHNCRCAFTPAHDARFAAPERLDE